MKRLYYSCIVFIIFSSFLCACNASTSKNVASPEVTAVEASPTFTEKDICKQMISLAQSKYISSALTEVENGYVSEDGLIEVYYNDVTTDYTIKVTTTADFSELADGIRSGTLSDEEYSKAADVILNQEYDKIEANAKEYYDFFKTMESKKNLEYYHSVKISGTTTGLIHVFKNGVYDSSMA